MAGIIRARIPVSTITLSYPGPKNQGITTGATMISPQQAGIPISQTNRQERYIRLFTS